MPTGSSHNPSVLSSQEGIQQICCGHFLWSMIHCPCSHICCQNLVTEKSSQDAHIYIWQPPKNKNLKTALIWEAGPMCNWLVPSIGCVSQASYWTNSSKLASPLKWNWHCLPERICRRIKWGNMFNAAPWTRECCKYLPLLRLVLGPTLKGEEEEEKEEEERGGGRRGEGKYSNSRAAHLSRTFTIPA